MDLAKVALEHTAWQMVQQQVRLTFTLPPTRLQVLQIALAQKKNLIRMSPEHPILRFNQCGHLVPVAGDEEAIREQAMLEALSVDQVRLIFKLGADLARLEEPRARLNALLQGLCTMTDATGGGAFECYGDPGDYARTPRYITSCGVPREMPWDAWLEPLAMRLKVERRESTVLVLAAEDLHTAMTETRLIDGGHVCHTLLCLRRWQISGPYQCLALYRHHQGKSFGLREIELVRAIVGMDLIGDQNGSDEGSIADLTGRERDVLLTLMDGYSEKEAAAQLGISRNTLHDYVRRLYHRFDVCTRAELLTRVSRSSRREPKRKPGTSVQGT